MLSNNVSLSVPTENISARPFAGVRVSYDRWEGAEGGSSAVRPSCYADMSCVHGRARVGDALVCGGCQDLEKATGRNSKILAVCQRAKHSTIFQLLLIALVSIVDLYDNATLR